MSQWIKCSERMPEDFIDVLVCTEEFQIHEGFRLVYGDGNSVWKLYCYNKIYENEVVIITHWMPLPEPPQE